MQRREFIKACVATCALAAPEARAQDLKPRFYSRARLVDEGGKPLRAADLVVGRNYIFHYPFEATPCFLLDLGAATGRDVALRTESGTSYRWPGGVGPRQSIVGFSAICSHRMTYPTQQISFISYREKSKGAARANVIHCCSEHSQYDPASGARVVGGPAPQPLSSVLLEYDPANPASDGLQAVGTLGGEMFEAFFAKFGFKLELEGGNGARRQVAGQAVVKDIQNYCKQQVVC
jgi:Rieske Fe-S protein